MRVIEVSNKVYIIRHWFRWYRVQRGASQWDHLEPIIKSGRLPRKPIDAIDQAAALLQKRGVGAVKPPIDLT